MSARFIVGDVRDVLASMPDASVDLVLTSPPFLALRSYLPANHPDKHREIGSEATPGAFIDTLLELTEEFARVLTPHGSLCLELGDTYSGSGGSGGDYSDEGLRAEQPRFDGSAHRTRASGERTEEESRLGVDARNRARRGGNATLSRSDAWPEAKSLCLIPELYRISLVYGRNPLTGRETPRWRARNVVRWCRPNPPVGCVDDATEALTPDGWKRHHELADGDLIAAYDPATDSCRFLPATFVRWQHNGELVAIDKRSTSQRLTLDHRAWTRTRKRGPHVRLAGDLTNDCDTLLCAPFDDVAGPAPVTVERAALLGWYVAEGTPHSRQARIVQSETANPQKVAEIRALLDRDGADYRETTYQHPQGSTVVTFHVKGELAEWLNLHHKRLPMQYVTTWPERQAQALFDALIDGDGHRRKTGRGHGILFHQQAEPIADAVQVLALRLGHRATKSFQPSMRLWQITIGRNRWTAVRKWDGVGIPRELYAGVVWCPQIETTFWLARRNGKTFVTGNSLGDKFRPATSEMVVACKSAKRWFDLDAVRHANPRVVERPARRGPTGYDDPAPQNPEGAPPLDWWEIPTQGYTGSHYATWPERLCVRPILSMCPQRVCRVCGEPSRRIVEKSPEYAEFMERESGRTLPPVDGRSNLNTSTERMDAEYVTLGWTDCGHDDYRAGVVLDPFAGSGTTLAVASGHGRDCIGVDLDARNAELALERVGPLLLTVEHFTKESVA